MSFLKATAITGFRFGMISSTDGSDITSGTPIGYYSLDSSPQAAITATPVYDNNGEFKVDLSSAELNGDIVGLTFKLAGAITVHFTIKTDTKLVSQLNDLGGVAQTQDHTAAIADIPTVAELATRTLASTDYFNPAVDTVATVTTVTNQPPAPDNTSIAAILVDTSTTIPDQITGLNDLAATDIVTGGAIATTAGAIDIVTTNVDMRGTDGANTIAPDNTSIASILADTAEIGVAGAGLTALGGMSTAMKAEVQVEVDNSLVSYDPPTNAQMELRTPTAQQLAYMVENAATGVPVTFSSGTTTTAVLDLVDGVTPSSSNDQYKGRLLIFTNGNLDKLVTDITGYNGTTKEVTVTAVTDAITATHTARLI